MIDWKREVIAINIMSRRVSIYGREAGHDMTVQACMGVFLLVLNQLAATADISAEPSSFFAV